MVHFQYLIDSYCIDNFDNQYFRCLIDSCNGRVKVFYINFAPFMFEGISTME